MGSEAIGLNFRQYLVQRFRNISVLLLMLLLGFTSGMAQRKDYPIQAVPFTSVKLADQFWLPHIKTNHTVTIPGSLVAIPYYAWAHRGKGEMTVWFPTRVKAVDIISE